MDGFKTCADVAKAEQEGEVVFYTTDPPQATTEVMNDFMKAFPKIKATFLRLQAGNLFQRLMSERQAKTNVADLMSISEMTFGPTSRARRISCISRLIRRLRKRNIRASRRDISPGAPYRCRLGLQSQAGAGK